MMIVAFFIFQIYLSLALEEALNCSVTIFGGPVGKIYFWYYNKNRNHFVLFLGPDIPCVFPFKIKGK
jgi:hypothetical protein